MAGAHFSPLPIYNPPDLLLSLPLVRLGCFSNNNWPTDTAFRKEARRRKFLVRSATVDTQPRLCPAAAAAAAKLVQRKDNNNNKVDDNNNVDDIALLNARIRRDHGKRDVSSGTAMAPEEADKYIRLVKEQQQRGLRKLKGERGRANWVDKGGFFNYRVDPYSLASGDYIVHKKVGIGRFVGIHFDVPKDGSQQPVEYVFIEYADGMAKLPLKQASRMLYRYNLFVTYLLLS